VVTFTGPDDRNTVPACTPVFASYHAKPRDTATFEAALGEVVGVGVLLAVAVAVAVAVGAGAGAESNCTQFTFTKSPVPAEPTKVRAMERDPESGAFRLT
jgi:hypothetical protein